MANAKSRYKVWHNAHLYELEHESKARRVKIVICVVYTISDCTHCQSCWMSDSERSV